MLVLVAVAPRFHALAVVADHVEHDMTVRFVSLIMTDYKPLRLVQPHHFDIVKSDFEHLFIAQFRLVLGGKRQRDVSGRVAYLRLLQCLSLETRYNLIAFFAHQTIASEYPPSVWSKNFFVVFLAGDIVNL